MIQPLLQQNQKMKHEIKEICSCGYCHMSYLEATAIRELIEQRLK